MTARGRVTSGAAVGVPALERPAAEQQTAESKRGAGPLNKQAGLVAEAEPRLRREGNGQIEQEKVNAQLQDQPLADQLPASGPEAEKYLLWGAGLGVPGAAIGVQVRG